MKTLNPLKVLTASAILGLCLCLLAPASAFAKNEFEDAFKGELGRIAAHHAASGGKHLLGAILFGSGHHGGGHGHGGQHGYYGRRHHYEYRGHGHHGGRHYRHYDRHYDQRDYQGGHRHGHHCGH